MGVVSHVQKAVWPDAQILQDNRVEGAVVLGSPVLGRGEDGILEPVDLEDLFEKATPEVGIGHDDDLFPVLPRDLQ